MKSILIQIAVLSGALISCSTKEQPKDLTESIAYFEKHWSSSQLREFKNKDEGKAVTELHFSVGLWIRNNWIHGKRNVQLVKFFDSLDFKHPDDISSTILTSLHRKLNNKDIDLQGQIAYYKAYWRPIIECEENLTKEVVETNQKVRVGDTLVIVFRVDTSQNYRNAVGSPCNRKGWLFDEAKDLRIEGIVTRKFDLGSDKNPFINYRITKMNRENTRILMQKLGIGDTTEFPLRLITIEWN